MAVYTSTRGKRACYLDDFNGRKFKTILPNLTSRICIGITCGYLIMFGKKTHDFLLVNPITRHELHFPVLSFRGSMKIAKFKGVLVFSPSLSGWVIVIVLRFTRQILFSLADERAGWNHISSGIGVLDLHAFKGKLYAVTIDSYVYDVRLNPEPALTLLFAANDFMVVQLAFPEFVSSSEKLFVAGFDLNAWKAWELDFEKMELKMETDMKKYVIFLSESKCGVVMEPEKWADRRREYKRLRYVLVADHGQRYGSLGQQMWYFPHDCYSVNLLQE